MNTFLNTNRLHHLLGWTLLGLMLLLLALEGWRYGVKPSSVNNEQVIQQSLSSATQFFTDQQQELLDRSEELVSSLRPALLQNRSSQYLNNLLSRYPDFWSAVLYQGNQPLTWQGFALKNTDQPGKQNNSESSITLERNNNVIYWQAHIPFTIQDSSGTVRYNLFTSYRIEQSNPLPIGDRSEFNLFNSNNFSSPYPLNFSIFSSSSSDFIQADPLSNLEGDSVGVVYATGDEFEQAEMQWEQNTRFWRSVYALVCFIVLVVILFRAFDQLKPWTGLALQLLFIGIGWGIFAYSNMAAYWVLTLSGLPETYNTTVESISTTCTNAIFALLATIAISRKLRYFKYDSKPDWYLTSIGTAGVFGLANAIIIPLYLHILADATISANVPLLDLRIFPTLGTITLYITLGIAVLAAGILLVAFNRVLFRVTEEHFKLSASILSASYFFSLFVAQLVITDETVFNWVFYFSLISAAIIFIIAAGNAKKVHSFTAMSPLRKVVLGSIFISLVSMPIIYQTSLDHTDEDLLATAKSYAQEKDPLAEEITGKLLSTLERKFRGVSEEQLQTNRSTLQAQFTQTIQQFLQPQWNAYSLDAQLINPSEELIADYSTDLNSPNWLNVFNINMQEASIEIEQITKSSIRPVVQFPQLINQQDYRTFYRGWIPIFSTSAEEPIAWILCSVYKERPEFNKPIRAVMASLTYDDWNTPYLMQKFQNNRLVNSTEQGFTGYFPKYRTLSKDKLQALEEDSLIYLTEKTSDYSYRTLLWKESATQTIKISTTLPGYRVTLFAFFRFSFSLLLAGCIALTVALLVTKGKITFFGKEKRFQDRILDSFLVATLVFLAFLIATSHYAIKQQNQDIVRQELVDKLESLSEAVQTNRSNNESSGSSSISLASLTTPFNVDASFYANRTVTETTTPQIYQQCLLPSALPYDIYHQLFIQRQQDAYSMVRLAGQSLLIGYRSLLNEENQPVATIAIPTFLESPKYDQQLLETTSYLILIYLVVFGLFILASTFISQKLTRPLVYIQQGLNKISGGNLDTTIPVTSKDEIGNLAKAYNNMVSRLKNLQKELAAAEREAAWKEMAQQVAHEIKNPLTPMKLNVQHLERQLKSDHQDPQELKERVQKITNNLIEQIQSLNNIASDFSKFSQPLNKDFSRVEITSLLLSVKDLYQHDEKVDIHFQSQNSTIYVQGIEDELKRVIINLVKNAYEAMPQGGQIVLRVYKKQHHVFIEVEDDGQGIAEEDRPNIFVPNFSTKSSGTGLGLAICKKIIEAHEGSISFASVEEEGTTFVIKLPGGKRLVSGN